MDLPREVISFPPDSDTRAYRPLSVSILPTSETSRMKGLDITLPHTMNNTTARRVQTIVLMCVKVISRCIEER
ncbi:hypothetical protein SDC9_164007 [bioreactor metagenome]|uniref:Uncharacterized protein n=1 Tax=bioreactor metagenome TaxID=1076179 RepID=A0A645FSQ6_9ZZZZ